MNLSISSCYLWLFNLYCLISQTYLGQEKGQNKERLYNEEITGYR